MVNSLWVMGLIVTEETPNSEKPVEQVSEMHFTLPGKGETGVVEKVHFFLLVFCGAFCFLLAHVPVICDRARRTTAVILCVINKVLILSGTADLLLLNIDNCILKAVVIILRIFCHPKITLT